MAITDEMVTEFKEDNRIFHSTEDAKVKRMLESSYADLKDRCGDFDISSNKKGKDLVFQQARYRYNDMLEYFYDNFLHDIHSLGISLIPLDSNEVI